jgi:hypothetical protein
MKSDFMGCLSRLGRWRLAVDRQAAFVPLLHAAAQNADIAETGALEERSRLRRPHLGSADKRDLAILELG